MPAKNDRERALMLAGFAVVIAGVGRIVGYPLVSALIGLPAFMAALWYAIRLEAT